MKMETLGLLACPLCQGELRLETDSAAAGEVQKGTLACSRCGKHYPIEEGIPRMMPAEEASGPQGTTGTIAAEVAPDKERALQKHLEVRDANIKYHDLTAEMYDGDVEKEVFLNPFNQARIEGIVKGLAGRAAGKRLLDVGCGNGNILKFGVKYFKQVIGVDISINMLLHARKRGFEVIQADSLLLPFKSGAFDAISVFSVLHHIYDYSVVFPQASRVMGPRGCLYTDWDPAMPPSIPKKGARWTLYRALSFLYYSGFRRRYDSSVGDKKRGVDIRAMIPTLKDTYALAEYHEKTEQGRGISSAIVKDALAKNGFTEIHINYHWAGIPFDGLTLGERLFWTLKSMLYNVPRESLLENIQIIACKGGG